MDAEGIAHSQKRAMIALIPIFTNAWKAACDMTCVCVCLCMYICLYRTAFVASTFCAVIFNR